MHVRRFCFVTLAAGMLAAACSSSAASAGDYAGFENAPAAAPTAASTFAGKAPQVASTAAPGSTSDGTGQSGAAAAASGNAAAPENQIVKTGTISIQVTNIDDSVIRATDQIHAFGGWLAGSERSSNTAEEMASETYRLPVARFEDALAAMRKLGTKVLNEHSESTSVGGQIVDLQARIANLKASEKAIQAIMAKATTIGDVLAVEQRLAEVQGQIEQLTGQLQGLTDQATYSTLTVVLVVPVVATPSPSASPTPSPSPTATPIPWNAGDQAGQAAGALGEVGKATATLVIWVAILIVPVTLVLILLLALLGLLGRIIDPYRKRLLPFTVARPVEFARPAWSPVPPPAYGPNAGVPAPPPQEKPKA